ncbi:MoaD/ThiS family protein [Janibacter terrae]|uniref:MoaD/ThiS family protein n=1 Tax=Janibacter terrae TaxID=103817 RepID=A0ABZ2FDR3_9MICO|nr:MoaD/ThiS family protein [Janibacter terrae]MBA4085268.1 MoaD/ThiS family protein [Kytococcus sp.]HBO53770.1 MoaD/ThiS family protein [Janibacter terrae]
MTTIRYFAAAAEAAGTDEERLDGRTVGEVLAQAEAAHGARLTEVLQRCSVLHAGRYVDDGDTPVTAGATIDVLPPFAGG